MVRSPDESFSVLTFDRVLVPSSLLPALVLSYCLQRSAHTCKTHKGADMSAIAQQATGWQMRVTMSLSMLSWLPLLTAHQR